jgi:hypothetical protein
VSFQEVFGYTGPVAEIGLLLAIVIKSRWRKFPAFSLMIALDLAFTVLDELAYDFGSRAVFKHLYTVWEVAAVLLQFAVVLELFLSVLASTGALTKTARRSLILITLSGTAVAVAASLSLQSPHLNRFLLLQLRADVFTGLLISEFVIAMMLSASQLGLPWRSHAMAIGQALMAWALFAVMVEGVAAYVGPNNFYYSILYYCRSGVYLGTVLYWTVALWHEEPAWKPISPALRKYIVALNDRLQYDLRKAGH